MQLPVERTLTKSMQTGLVGSWAVSCRLPYLIAIENQHKKALEASVQYPLDFLIPNLIYLDNQCNMALETPWQFPVDFPIKSLLKINAKWTCGPLGSFL